MLVRSLKQCLKAKFLFFHRLYNKTNKQTKKLLQILQKTLQKNPTRVIHYLMGQSATVHKIKVERWCRSSSFTKLNSCIPHMLLHNFIKIKTLLQTHCLLQLKYLISIMRLAYYIILFEHFHCNSTNVELYTQ